MTDDRLADLSGHQIDRFDSLRWEMKRSSLLRLPDWEWDIKLQWRVRSGFVAQLGFFHPERVAAYTGRWGGGERLFEKSPLLSWLVGTFETRVIPSNNRVPS